LVNGSLIRDHWERTAAQSRATLGGTQPFGTRFRADSDRQAARCKVRANGDLRDVSKIRPTARRSRRQKKEAVELKPAPPIHRIECPRSQKEKGMNEEFVDYWSLLFVFVLSAFIGLGVIGRVSRLLHTPLMSLTNAISAIAVVGSIMVTGSDYPRSIRLMGAIALFASMTNIVSGFLITDRMLRMFKQTRQPEKP
jgi:H+-translocating NAD(P) transhydrogenase subunit alpha